MDKEPFWKLLKPVHPAAAAFCRKLAGSREGGDDLYQDGLLAALRKFRTLKDQAAFRPWLFRILVNTFKNRYRQGWRRRRVVLTADMLENRKKIDPRGQVVAYRCVKEILKVLTLEDRALVILFEIEGWSVRELAEMTGKPGGTVKVRLSRARRKMRSALERRLPKAKSDYVIEEQYALQRSKTVD
jgi:RNA polymerase sigma-70 factor (ECF subfamily)